MKSKNLFNSIRHGETAVNLPAITSLINTSNLTALSEVNMDAILLLRNDPQICDMFVKSMTYQEHYWLLSNDELDWLKYLAYRIRFRIYPKLQLESKFPVYLQIEPTSACNLRCKMCWQSNPTFSKSGQIGNMEMSLFKKIVDDAVNCGVEAVTIVSRGESLLHPDLPEMLNYIKDKFIDLKINTNATLLTEELSRVLLRSNFSIIVFSIDAAEKNLYESIRVRGKWEDVHQNVKQFDIIRKNEFEESQTLTRVSGVSVVPEQDWNVISTFWEDYVDEVGYVEMIPMSDTYGNPKDGIVKTCEYIWQVLHIYQDGRINPCDLDYEGKLFIANMRTSDIQSAWDSKKMKKLRQVHLSGGRQEINPCDRCGFQ
jgi:radical SAM protein with 4Fe4S-binding SPASM domain